MTLMLLYQKIYISKGRYETSYLFIVVNMESFTPKMVPTKYSGETFEESSTLDNEKVHVWTLE